MPDFRDLLSTPLDDVARPPQLPDGTYHGQIKSYSPEESREKGTPFIRFQLQLNSPTDDVDTDKLDGIDLSKRSLRKDFYLTPDSMYRIKEFIVSLGIKVEGRKLTEALAETVGEPVLVKVANKINKNNPEESFTEVTSVGPDK